MLSAECFSALNFEKICLLKSKWCSQIKVEFNVLNLNDKVKISDMLKGTLEETE
jgi:hypothetical protein